MSKSKKFCIHSDGLGYCDILSDDKTRQYCVEGPCPHEQIVEYMPVVRCKDCKHFLKAEVNGNGFLICSVTDKEIYEHDFCSYGERRSE